VIREKREKTIGAAEADLLCADVAEIVDERV